jgi:chromosome segregation ATPase
MNIFDGGKGDQIKFLEEERKKIWDRLSKLEGNHNELKNEFIKKASESEKEAAQSSKKAAEYKNKTEARLNEANYILAFITEVKGNSERIVGQIMGKDNEATKRLSTIIESESNYKSKLLEIEEDLTKIEGVFEKYPDLDAEIEKIDDFVASVEENSEKSDISVEAINTKKKDIDNLHRQLFGYTQKNDATGETTKVEGIKNTLENIYNELSDNIIKTKSEVGQINIDYSSKYQQFESGFKTKYENIVSQIAGLLPGALTTGLSAAYSAKKNDEETNLEANKVNFRNGIIALFFISLLPVALSIVFILQQVSLTVVIERLPRIVFAIIPIYIPALWYTLSASKKVNLSKRLIEEYTHKEVISKTFEGLSKQIDNLGEDAQSEELRRRLLTNILQVSSENPGKLISNYNSSDHPVMEALEQSYKFQIAIDKLEGIPGMGKIAAIVESSSKRKLENKAKIIEEGLELKNVVNGEKEIEGQ